MRRAGRLVLLALGSLCGCGYQTGFTLPESRSIGVAIFDNISKERDVEAQLHAALTQSVERLVHAPLFQPSRADYVVDGRVIDYARRGGIRSAENVLLETGVRITVEARLIRRSGADPGASAGAEDVLRQVLVSDDRGYLVSDPVGEANARAAVLRNLADRVVIDLFADIVFTDPPPPER